ncbi:MAG: Thioredoxin [uncultured marine phage]|uniref:Thioredoxin n=1 Tax=uncultured marine phage TaxID=707152 RepID=A0A8D9FQH1_9VIRU|nr:MAG: Thioredoxin [uncultured marine phage]
MKRFFKLVLLSLSVMLLLTNCGEGEVRSGEDYNNIEDHGRVGEKIDDLRFLDSEYAIVQFSADWCVWCRKQYPNLIESSKIHLEVDYYLLDVDSEDGKKIKEDYGVKGLPTTIYFENGEEICRETGYQSPEDIEEEINYLTNY